MNRRYARLRLFSVVWLVTSLFYATGEVRPAQTSIALAATPTTITLPVFASTDPTLTPCQADSKNKPPVAPANPTPPPDVISSLSSELHALIERYKDKGQQATGILIKDQATQQIIAINADRVFASASLYKLFVLWRVQLDINAGRLSDNTAIPVVNYDEGDGTQPTPTPAPVDTPVPPTTPTPTPEPTPVPTITVNEARRQMITVSDNSAAWSLATAVGWSRIDDMLSAHNFTATRIARHDPITTANEITHFFEGIYNRNLDSDLTKADYDLMLALLKAQQVNYYLSPGFPSGTVFAHKTGSQDEVQHDAGIVFTPDGRALFITVLTEGNAGADVPFMQEVAGLVWRNLAVKPLPRFFPPTGKTVSDKFLEYWLANGGLESFGYPLTEARPESNQATGKTYLTQWFERSRFELHPENAGTANEVLLGLLGVELCNKAIQTDPRFQPTPPIVDKARPEAYRYFPPTGHNLGFGFLTYWQQHGALARFGYPISEEHLELDPETGRIYTVQWFERARFEYHPEKAGTPYEVLLGLLGKQGLG